MERAKGPKNQFDAPLIRERWGFPRDRVTPLDILNVLKSAAVIVVAEKEKGAIHGRVDHESLGSSLDLVGYCRLTSTGEFGAARQWFERAVAEKERGNVHGRVDHASLAQTLRTGARCLRVLGLVEQSQAWDDRASHITRRD
jgi:hypothetical protein